LISRGNRRVTCKKRDRLSSSTWCLEQEFD
jgi:hypothetical protein